MKTRLLVCVYSAALALTGCRADSNGDESAQTARPSAPPNVNRGADLPEVGSYSSYLAQPRLDVTVAEVSDRMTTPGKVASLDHRRGVPTFFYAARNKNSIAQRIGDTEDAALAHVDAHRELYELGSEALATTRVESVMDSGRGGRVVELRQRVAGLEVYGTKMNVVMNRQNELVALSGNLHSAATHGAPVNRAGSLTSQEALAKAFSDVTGGDLDIEALTVAATQPARPAVKLAFRGVMAGRTLPQPASIKRVLYPLAKELVPAYHVELEVAPENSTDSRMYSYVIAADNGDILDRQNLTLSHSYRVWADPDGKFTPTDGPHGDTTPHPTGDANTEIDLNVVTERNLIAMNGFNTNPNGGSDPWLADDATETRGNNIVAYADHELPSGFGEGDTMGKPSAPGVFDWPYDPSISPFDSEENIQGAITQIFYVTNWLHDHYYDSGFTETARNAQVSNFGRGGVDGDPLLAEAQDTKGLATNNANMATPSDGLSPRMQMYLWQRTVTVGETFFTVTAPETLAGTYEAAGSQFGVDAHVTASGNLIIAADGGGEGDGATPADGCEELVTDVTGKIAIVDRGQCAFVQKAQNAEAAGAAALIIVNNDEANKDALPPLGGDNTEIAIPVLGISFNNGVLFKEALTQESTVAADVSRAGREPGPFRDGTLDNGIVAHEWGHYFHHRLSFCGGTPQCGGMSEGWGDFISIKMHMREADKGNLDGVYAAAAYSTRSAYFGIRRGPYSTDFSKNALTFKHIEDGIELPQDTPFLPFGRNSQVHNAGEIWSNTLWEAYVSLLKESQGESPRMTFEEADRRFSDYITQGLFAAPVNATYTEVRDAILGVAAANDEEDLRVIADAFARRGMGTGAESPDRAAPGNVGVEESFVTAGDIRIVSAELAVEGETDCDEDGVLDAADSANLTMTIVNSGPVALTNTVIEVDNSASLSFPEGVSKPIADLGPYEAVTVTVPMSANDVAGIQSVSLTFRAENDDAIEQVVSETLVRRINYNNRPAAAKKDDVESDIVVWNLEQLTPELAWSRKQVGAPNHAWFAPDSAAAADMKLESPSLSVGSQAFIVTFEHRFGFESSPDQEGNIVNWDGAVIELSTDGGSTWEDVLDFNVNPGYTGTLTDQAQLPLGGREGFAGNSAGFPNFASQSLNFGTQFEGKNVKIRFRVATDNAVGAFGWEIDNLEFAGITNKPFAVIEADNGSCRLGTGNGGTGNGGTGGTDNNNPGPMSSSGGCNAPGGSAGWLLGLLGVACVARRRR